ncbi:MAG: hypothetical protein ACYC5Y_03145 [Symbiobacteriia bacterium]
MEVLAQAALDEACQVTRSGVCGRAGTARPAIGRRQALLDAWCDAV